MTEPGTDVVSMVAPVTVGGSTPKTKLAGPPVSVPE
jgi:hypothetical protein